MKKRILTWLLAISMLGSLLTVPAGAAAVTKFSDVSDSYTATAVETLRLMGASGKKSVRLDLVFLHIFIERFCLYVLRAGHLSAFSRNT